MSHPQPNPATICLSLATLPFLLGLLAVQSLLDELVELGEASEEIFRSTRLPALKFPAEAEETN
jgi:hypothetical protein